MMTLTTPLVIGALVLVPVARSSVNGTTGLPQSKDSLYTVFDDASWAIVTPQLSGMLGEQRQSIYNSFMEECHIAAPPEKSGSLCAETEAARLHLNFYQPQSMRNYTALGFKKTRAPADAFELIKTFWMHNRDKATVEWDHVSPYHNNWEAPPTFVSLQNPSLPGGGKGICDSISAAVREVLEEWTGQKLVGGSVYGIRVYPDQSILAPHVDRDPLVTSVIINVDQDVDEDWVLEVYGHDGKATNVTMKPGDMVLYESHSVIHGRPFALKGKFFANVFVHFEPIGSVDFTDDLPGEKGLPSYIIEGSTSEANYWKASPNGWKTLDITSIVKRGDIYALEYVAQVDSSRLTQPDSSSISGLQAIHLAAVHGQARILVYLLDELGADVNAPYYAPFGMTPLTLAKRHLPADRAHEIMKILLDHGGLPFLQVYGVAKR